MSDSPRSGLSELWSNFLRLPQEIRNTRLRHREARSDRERSQTITSSLFLHIHSVHTHKNSLRPSYTLGLGLITAILFLILCITGVILMLFYVPSTSDAYDRVRDLEHVVPGGLLIRNLHRWSAHGMVLTAFLHMARVFYTASYRTPRELNWIVGLLLLVLTLALSFTGYLLPWDQLGFWAVTIGANIASSPQELTDAIGVTEHFDPGGFIRRLLLGGTTVGQDALLRFYVLHCVVLPVATMGLVAFHIWRIRKDGGLSRPTLSSSEQEDGAEKSEKAGSATKTYGLMAIVRGTTPEVGKPPSGTVMTWPHLLIVEATVFMFLLGGLVLLSIIFDAPLAAHANPAMPENPAKAPWYFLGLQELVSYSALMGGLVVPSIAIVGLGLVPYLDRGKESTGIWFTNPMCRRTAIAAAAFSTVFVIALLSFTVHFGWIRAWFPGVPQLVVIFVNPATVIVLALALWSLGTVVRTGSVRAGAVALFTMFLVAFVILTIMGMQFRGPNWDFYWSASSWPGAHG